MLALQVSTAFPLPVPAKVTEPLVSKLEPEMVRVKPEVGPLVGLSAVTAGAEYENEPAKVAVWVAVAPKAIETVTILTAKPTPVL